MHRWNQMLPQKRIASNRFIQNPPQLSKVRIRVSFFSEIYLQWTFSVGESVGFESVRTACRRKGKEVGSAPRHGTQRPVVPLRSPAGTADYKAPRPYFLLEPLCRSTLKSLPCLFQFEPFSVQMKTNFTQKSSPWMQLRPIDRFCFC